MKRFLISLFLAVLGFSLSAQSTQTVSVFMPPFTGNGIDQYDSSFFYMMIYRELEANNKITMGRGRTTTNYSLIGTIISMGPAGSSSPPEYRFDLYLQNNTTTLLMLEQRYRYTRLENANIAVDIMLDNVYKLILPEEIVLQPVNPQQQPGGTAPSVRPPVWAPVQPVQQPPDPVQPPIITIEPPILIVEPPAVTIQTPDEPDQPGIPVNDWRDKWFFLGLSAAWIPRIYIVVGEEPYQSFNWRNFGFGFSLGLHFLDSVAVETGLGLSPEWIVYESQNYQDLLLEFPLLLKIVLKPGDNFLLEPYSGVSINIPLFGVTKPPPISWLLGYQHSIKTGPGALFFDFRFSMDIGNSTLEERPGIPTPNFQRLTVSVGAGYKYGILPKR